MKKFNFTISEGLKIMKNNIISHVLVTDNNDSFIGVVHILDIIKQGINDE